MASQTSGLEEDVEAELQALESELAADNEVRHVHGPRPWAGVELSREEDQAEHPTTMFDRSIQHQLLLSSLV